jgi:hypothetical protein
VALSFFKAACKKFVHRMIEPIILPKISSYLQNDQPFRLLDGGLVEVYAKAKFVDLKLPVVRKEFENSNFESNAKWFANSMKDMPREYNKHSELVKVTKLFLLKTSNAFKDKPLHQQCEHEILALKLGIHADILHLDVNKNFISFAANFFLHNSLKTFNHKLKVNAVGEIKLLYQGRYLPWSRIERHLQQKMGSPPFVNTHPDPYALNIYGYQGLQYKDRYKWKSLNPLLKGDLKNFAPHFISISRQMAKLPLFLLEFCTTTTTHPRIVGDHTFLRMYKYYPIESEKEQQPQIEGEVRSVGIYRPGKKQWYEHIIFPLRLKPAKIAQNDISEVWGINEEIQKFSVEITEKAYHNIIAKIEQDKKNTLPYHLFEQNCDTYVTDLARLGGINLPSRRHVLEVYGGIGLKQPLNEKVSTLPTPLKVSAYIAEGLVQSVVLSLTPVFNAISYVCGSGFFSEDLPKGTTPQISSIHDLFNPEKLYTSSPWVLGNIIKDDIEKWRVEEIAKLPETNWGLEMKQKIAFALPSRYKIDPQA